MDGITLINDFVHRQDEVFRNLYARINWDERMSIRKTASFGVAYNYSQISYPDKPMLPELVDMAMRIASIVGFTPNNCLVNYYADGSAKMGYHADQTDILEPGTGVLIVSLGAVRILRFRSILNKTETVDFELTPGSLFYMTQEVQTHWQHAIPEQPGASSRMSLTFRYIK